MHKYLLTFYTHFEAITALKQAKQNKSVQNAKLIAVPRKISSSCGTAVVFTAESEKFLEDFEYEHAFECFGEEDFNKL